VPTTPHGRTKRIYPQNWQVGRRSRQEPTGANREARCKLFDTLLAASPLNRAGKGSAQGAKKLYTVKKPAPLPVPADSGRNGAAGREIPAGTLHSLLKK